MRCGADNNWMKMRNSKLPFPANDYADYRRNLLSLVFDKTHQARHLIDAYKALCICVLAETADDYAPVEFLQNLALEGYYEDIPQGDEASFIDVVIDLAEDMMGFEAYNDQGPYEHVLLKRNDFATLDPDQTWIYYVPNAIFSEMELCLSGRIPAIYDSNVPHVFDSYNKDYSNKVLEKKIEIADYMIDFLMPMALGMMDLLKERLDITCDCNPVYFVEVIRRAKSEGFDVSEPLRSDERPSWFEKCWPLVVEEAEAIASSNNDADWDYDFPDDVIMQ